MMLPPLVIASSPRHHAQLDGSTAPNLLLSSQAALATSCDWQVSPRAQGRGSSTPRAFFTSSPLSASPRHRTPCVTPREQSFSKLHVLASPRAITAVSQSPKAVKAVPALRAGSTLTADALLFGVLPFLTGGDVMSCAQVSRQWRDCASDQELWRGLCQRDSVYSSRKRRVDSDWRKVWKNAQSWHASQRRETGQEATARWTFIRLLGVLAVLAVPFVVLLVSIATQHSAIATFTPVPATVLKAEVHSRNLDGAMVDSPMLDVAYTVGGREYRADDSQLYPLALFRLESLQPGLSAEASRIWVTNVLNTVRANSVVYVNPSDPTQCFLLPERQLWPYALLFAGLAAFGAFLFTELFHSSRDAIRPVSCIVRNNPHLGGSCHELTANYWTSDLLSEFTKRRLASVVAVIMFVVSGAAMNQLPVWSDWWVILPFALCFMSACALLKRTTVNWFHSLWIGDLSVSLADPNICRGVPNLIAVVQRLKRRAVVQDVRISLVCSQTERTFTLDTLILPCPFIERSANPSSQSQSTVAQSTKSAPGFTHPASGKCCDCEMSAPLALTAKDHGGHEPSVCPHSLVFVGPKTCGSGSIVTQLGRLKWPAMGDEEQELLLRPSSWSADIYPVVAWFLRVELELQLDLSDSPLRFLSPNPDVRRRRDFEITVQH